MRFEKFEENIENPENNKEVEENKEKISLGERFSQSWNNFKNKFKESNEDSSEISENSEKGENPEKKNSEKTEYDLNTNEGRRKYREDAVAKFEGQLFDTVVKHGEMLKNRRDISPDEKNELQAEITEKAKKSIEEYKKDLENDSRYKDLD